MVIPSDLPVPESWSWVGLAIHVAVLARAAIGAPWGRLRDGELQHVFLGAVVALMFLWTIRGTPAPGFGVHLLGATVLTLMFGWRLALVAMALAQGGLALYGLMEWRALGLEGLTGAVVPVAVSHGVLRLVERLLPPHLFVYIFLCGFFGAALAMAASVAAQAGVLVMAGAAPPVFGTGAGLPLLPLIMLPEAFLNGVLVTALVGMRPRWIWTFDDARYLGRR